MTPRLSINQAKSMFFDRQKVMRRVEAGKRQALSKAGAFVRTSARTSIRKRRAASAPGQPPSSHTGLLRNGILFGYDAAADTVVIGPVRTNQVFFNGYGEPVTGTVPGVLEHGGDIWVLEVFRHNHWQRADLRSKRRIVGNPTRKRKVTIAARPYMLPALEANRHMIPLAFRNTVKEAA